MSLLFVLAYLSIPEGCNLKAPTFLVEGVHGGLPKTLNVIKETDSVFQFVMSVAQEDKRMTQMLQIIEKLVDILLFYVSLIFSKIIITWAG